MTETRPHAFVRDERNWQRCCWVDHPGAFECGLPASAEAHREVEKMCGGCEMESRTGTGRHGMPGEECWCLCHKPHPWHPYDPAPRSIGAYADDPATCRICCKREAEHPPAPQPEAKEERIEQEIDLTADRILSVIAHRREHERGTGGLKQDIAALLRLLVAAAFAGREK